MLARANAVAAQRSMDGTRGVITFLDQTACVASTALTAMYAEEYKDSADPGKPMAIIMPGTYQEAQHEEVKEWVVAISMNQGVEKALPVDEQGFYEASLEGPKGTLRALPCLITGCPVSQNKLQFQKPGILCNKDDWNKFLLATKLSRSAECQDVLKFITEWAGGAPNFSYFFE